MPSQNDTPTLKDIRAAAVLRHIAPVFKELAQHYYSSARGPKSRDFHEEIEAIETALSGTQYPFVIVAGGLVDGCPDGIEVIDLTTCSRTSASWARPRRNGSS